MNQASIAFKLQRGQKVKQSGIKNGQEYIFENSKFLSQIHYLHVPFTNLKLKKLCSSLFLPKHNKNVSRYKKRELEVHLSKLLIGNKESSSMFSTFVLLYEQKVQSKQNLSILFNFISQTCNQINQVKRNSNTLKDR